MAGRQDLRRDQRQRSDHETAERRPHERRQRYPIEQRLAESNAAHQCNAEGCGEKPDRTRHHEITTGDARDVERSDSHRCRIEQIGDDVADQRSQSHGSEACDRIASDHDFERIECSPKWRSECTRDRARRSAPNQYAQISAPEVEGTPDPRPNAARQLRVAGLETDRGANSTRPHGLQRHADASDERHTPTVQGVGLDRIDLPRRPPSRECHERKAEDQTANQRDHDGA